MFEAEVWAWLVTFGLIIGLFRCGWISYQRFVELCLLIVDVPLSVGELPDCRIVIR